MGKKHLKSKENNEEFKKNRKDLSPKVPQRDKLHQELTIFHREDLTEKQKKYLEIIQNKKTNIVFIKGAAGTSKTYLTVYAALLALNSKAQSDILYVRAPIEVGKSIGYLPGEFSDKVENYLIPMQDKLLELLPKPEVDLLIKENRISGTVPNYLRGQNWNARFVIVDEAQNLCAASMKVIISRLGKYGKLVFLADENQADVKGPMEFMRYFDLFNDETSKEKGIHCLSFGREDIVRSPILAYILDKVEGIYNPPTKNEPMFPVK